MSYEPNVLLCSIPFHRAISEPGFRDCTVQSRNPAFFAVFSKCGQLGWAPWCQQRQNRVHFDATSVTRSKFNSDLIRIRFDSTVEFTSSVFRFHFSIASKFISKVKSIWNRSEFDSEVEVSKERIRKQIWSENNAKSKVHLLRTHTTLTCKGFSGQWGGV